MLVGFGNQNNISPSKYFIAVVISYNTSVTLSFMYKQKGGNACWF